jgi:hypothetical protein
MAGAWQLVCLRVFAPHRGALAGFPGGLLFFSHPDPTVFSFTFGILVFTSPFQFDLVVVLADLPHDGLPTLVHMNVLHSHFLFEFTAITAQGFCKVGKYPHNSGLPAFRYVRRVEPRTSGL